MTIKKQGLASLVEGLPPTYWLLWSGTLINRLGGFVIPFLTLYLTDQRGIPVSQAALRNHSSLRRIARARVWIYSVGYKPSTICGQCCHLDFR
jgi:hypothetical protein